MTPEKLIELWYAETIGDSPDAGIMFALMKLARRHPQWFDAELTGDPSQMLFEAIAEAQDDMVSRKLIEAAYWLIKSNPDWLSDPQPVSKEWDAGYAAGAKAQREADHRLLVSRRSNWAAWLIDAIPLDTDDDTTTVTSGIEAAKRMEYAKGWGDGYAEGHAVGYRDAALRFADGGEA